MTTKTGQYSVRYVCDNCGWSGSVAFDQGTRAPNTTRCTKCGCYNANKKIPYQIATPKPEPFDDIVRREREYPPMVPTPPLPYTTPWPPLPRRDNDLWRRPRCNIHPNCASAWDKFDEGR